ncbi:PhzF family phenazine biosynthesis protein [Acidovorax sp. DW039]|uniref:PhzF family phenazine biosynthesis protein n=1 Tax=Acidovorax sp. DW039 TaxID=3095606 RepID=UPI0030888D4B|nr:PhzF family phenazine biosynthesis protein [Acidovorax sp. DW039]
MRQRHFKQIDVFSHQPGFGNPVAVVLDAQGLSDSDMRRFAAWTNLSETTFLLPPTEAGHTAGADYRLRIFSPRGELPFAGHPTLGTCRAWLQQGNTPRVPGLVVQESAQGLVQIEHRGEMLAFAAPPLKRSQPSPALVPLIASALGLRPPQIRDAQLLDNGPVWLGLLLDSAETVLSLAPDHARLKDLGQDVGVIHLNPDVQGSQHPAAIVRAFAAPMGNPEDPVTGSLNASLAQWLISEGLAPSGYVVAQGECLGRAGRVHIRQDMHGQVWVGGHTVTCIEGTALL